MRVGLVTFDCPAQYRRADVSGQSPVLQAWLNRRREEGRQIG